MNIYELWLTTKTSLLARSSRFALQEIAENVFECLGPVGGKTKATIGLLKNCGSERFVWPSDQNTSPVKQLKYIYIYINMFFIPNQPMVLTNGLFS